MPSRNFSAVQRLSQALRAYQRNYSGRTLLEKGYDAFGRTVNPADRPSWPIREESFAAAQVLRQNRNWNNYKRFGTDSESGSSQRIRKPDTMSQQKRLSTARSVSGKRMSADALVAKNLSQARAVEEQSHPNEQRDDDEPRRELCTVREAIFGHIDNDDDHRKQLEADSDLLRRMTSQKRNYPEPTLSRKVIAPYSTYHTHRNSWGEFRHRMIYGKSNI